MYVRNEDERDFDCCLDGKISHPNDVLNLPVPFPVDSTQFVL